MTKPRALPGSVSAILLFAAACTATPVTHAESDEHRFYIGPRIIGSLANMDVDTSGFAGTIFVEQDDDFVLSGGGVVGYSFQDLPLRAELEGVYRYRFDLEMRDIDAPDGTVDFQSDVATTTLLLNVLYDWENNSAFTPYFGGTIGWARNSTETRFGPFPGPKGPEKDSDEDNLAWGGTLGVDWALAERWSASLAYRYIDLGEVSTGALPNSNGRSYSSDDYISHDFVLSLYYRF